MEKEKPPLIHIYYDGNCPLCNVFADTVTRHDIKQILTNVNSDTLSTALSKEILLKEMYLVENGIIRTGPDAIFTSLARIYPILKPLVFLVRLPLLNWLSRQVYFFISKRRLLWIGGDGARLFWLFIITNLGLLAGIILSWPAWHTERSYPLIPIFSEINWLSPFTSLIALTLIVTLIISLGQSKNFRFFSLISLVFLLPLVLLDITRLQPWILHYAGLLFLLSWTSLYSALRTSQIIDAARFVVVGIYFWSGIQKMNTGFVLETFPSFTENLWQPLGDIGGYIVILAGILTPFIESALAIGLLTKRFRKISIIGSGAMLLLITSSIILGSGWNSVVWPWNFAIFSMVLILFYGYEDSISDLFKRTKKNLLAIFTISLFIILPLGNFFGLVDNYLSWSLYSNHVPTASITASKETLSYLTQNTTEKTNETGELTVLHWSMESMNLVPYPEERVFLNLFGNLCEKYSDPNFVLTITNRPKLFSNNPTYTNYDCTLKALSKTE